MCGGIVTEVDDDDEFFPIIFYPPALIHFLKLWMTYGDVYQRIDIHHPFEEDQRYTAPHKYRDRPRDSASLGGSPGYQRYQKISRMLRQVCESQFFSA